MLKKYLFFLFVFRKTVIPKNKFFRKTSHCYSSKNLSAMQTERFCCFSLHGLLNFTHHSPMTFHHIEPMPRKQIRNRMEQMKPTFHHSGWVM